MATTSVDLIEIARSLAHATPTEIDLIQLAVDAPSALSNPSVAIARWRRRCEARGATLIPLRDLRAAAKAAGSVSAIATAGITPGIVAPKKETARLGKLAQELGLA